MKCANVKIRFKNVCAWLSFLPPGTWHSNVMLSPSLNGPTEPCPSTCLPRSSIINGFWGGTEKYEIHLILNLFQTNSYLMSTIFFALSSSSVISLSNLEKSKIWLIWINCVSSSLHLKTSSSAVLSSNSWLASWAEILLFW